MSNVLIVERLGSIKSTSMKTVNEDEFYKKAGFKTATDFQLHHVFKVKVGDSDPYNIHAPLDSTQSSRGTCVNIHLYGKIVGKANQENKYDFPPPVDNTLFFGNCLLVNKNDEGKVLDLSVELWEKIYEKLFGGFEDLTGDDSEDEIGTEERLILEDPTTQFTKEGYVKDDFIVDDESDELLDDSDDTDDLDEEELDDDDSEIDLQLPTKKPTKNTKTSFSTAKSSNTKVSELKEAKVAKVVKPPKAPVSSKVRTTTTKDKKSTKSKRTADDAHSDAPSVLICQDELAEEEYFA